MDKMFEGRGQHGSHRMDHFSMTVKAKQTPQCDPLLTEEQNTEELIEGHFRNLKSQKRGSRGASTGESPRQDTRQRGSNGGSQGRQETIPLDISPSSFSKALAQGKNARGLFSKTGLSSQGSSGAKTQNMHRQMDQMRPGSKKAKSNGQSAGKAPNSPQKKDGMGVKRPSYEVAEMLQPLILQSSGGVGAGGKKQSSIYAQQRANAAKFKYAKQEKQPFFSQNTTKECTFCGPSHAHTATHAQHSSCFLNSNMSIKQQRMIPPQNLIMKNLGRKYGNCHTEFENIKVVNDLIYNETTHVVSIFKDYLILDDINEFLKRFYSQETECKVRLPKLCEFYMKYSQVFPNFVSLPESKYMFRNIQRKQRLIDEQFNRHNQNEEDGEKRQKASLLRSANKLFSVGFIDSVMNQKQCSMLTDDGFSTMRLEAKEKRYLESAKRLEKIGGESHHARNQSHPFQPENLDRLVQKFLAKDTESTIRLNSSMGQVGDDILGDTFQRELSNRNSIVTATENSKADIGCTELRSDFQIENRMSVISASSALYQSQRKKQESSTVATKIGPTITSTKPGHRTLTKKTKTGNLGLHKKSTVLKQAVGPTPTLSTLQHQLQKSVTSLTAMKQKMTTAAVSGNTMQMTTTQQQMQLGSRSFPQPQPQASSSRQGQGKRTKLARNETEKTSNMMMEQKCIRNNYLECDIAQEGQLEKKRQSGTIESGSQSPVEGIMNPLSAQPLLSKTSMSTKTTQPGNSLGFFKQRSSEICLESATPTQHLYHSKQVSIKDDSKNLKLQPNLAQMQLQVENDYYTSSGLMTTKNGQHQLRSLTAMHSTQGSNRPTMLSRPAQNKQVSRERSPPLMQVQQHAKKGKKSPHQKKDKRSKHETYDTGKSSVTSMKSSSTRPQRISPKAQQKKTSKTSMGLHQQAQAAPASTTYYYHPVTTETCSKQKVIRPQHHRLYSQTEINEAEEDYPEDEIADEIPDGDDTEDEQEHLVDEDEGHANEQIRQTTVSVKAKLRPIDMLPTHGGAFTDENVVTQQTLMGGARAQTTMSCHNKVNFNQHQFDQTISNSTMGFGNSAALGNNNLAMQQTLTQAKLLSPSTATNNLALSENDRLLQRQVQNFGHPRASDFNSTQQPAFGQSRQRVQTDLEIRTDGRLLATGHVQLPPKMTMPSTTTHSVNRPNTNIMGRQSMSIRSKFSRENSTSSRQDTNTQSQRVILVEDSQKFQEASMKLGGKALVGGQALKELTSSLQSSNEVGKMTWSVYRPTPQSLAVSNQASLSSTRLLKATKPKTSSSMIKKQATQQYKVDLSTRLAQNLVSDQIKKKIDSGKGTSQGSKLKQLPLGTVSLVQSVLQQAPQNKSSFTKQQQPTPSQKQQRGGMTTQNTGASTYQKRKAVTSQSPQQDEHSLHNKLSQEKIGFKAMGSGKASYLTNVVSTGAVGGGGGLGSRNFTSPYASANQYQRVIPKDSSGGSLPKTKPMSRSPEALMLHQQKRLQKQSNNQHLSLQQQLQQINRQLTSTSQRLKPGSFRQSGASPSFSSNSVSKSIKKSVLSPQTGSVQHTAEKAKGRSSLDRQVVEMPKRQSLQRSVNQQIKQSFSTSQALISLPKTAIHQKNYQVQLSKAIGSQLKAAQGRQGLTASIEKLSKGGNSSKGKSSGGAFLGTRSSMTKVVTSPPSQQRARLSVGSKKRSTQDIASDRSLKSQIAVNHIGSVQVNNFQSSMVELRKDFNSIEEVNEKAASSSGLNRVTQKKPSTQSNGKQLRKQLNPRVVPPKVSAVSLSPQGLHHVQQPQPGKQTLPSQKSR